MSESVDSKDNSTLELENSINMLPIEELKDIHNPDLLVKYLQDLNKIYEHNLEKRFFLEKAQLILSEDISLVQKKIKTIEGEITKKKENLSKNIITLKDKKNNRRRSFFENLQQDNEKEILLKKNNILTEEIKNLELSKKQSVNSNHNFCDLTMVNFDKKNSEIIILIKKILEILKNEKIGNISRDNYLIIEKSIEISDFTFLEYKITYSPRKQNHMLLYLGISIPLLFFSYYYKLF